MWTPTGNSDGLHPLITCILLTGVILENNNNNNNTSLFLRKVVGLMLGLCVALTLCQELGDGFAVVLRAVTLLSSELLISGFHALLKTTAHNTKSWCLGIHTYSTMHFN